MSPQSTVADIRLNNTIACLTPVITLLNELTDAFGTPFVPAISNTTLSLITAVQVRYVLYSWLLKPRGIFLQQLWTMSGNSWSMDDAMTLHKIHTFVEAQQGGSKIKFFFRQTETKTLLSECQAGLQQAVELFKTEADITVLGHITQMQEEAEIMHKEVFELISTWSDGTTSDRSSSIYNTNGSQNSSKSISMFPAKPKIFYGRETELREIIEALDQEMPRIAILGAGGMGKTSLAKATLHHPDIAAKYEQCFFVVADSVTTSVELSGLIGEHIGLKPANDLTTQVLHYFATHGPSLVILDNLETSWEPLESRGEVEELLSKLTGVPHLTLVITMREDMHDSKDVDEVLSLTDNMPLAVDLIAHAVDLEGSCSTVLARWKSEKTSLLSAGNDRKSNLDTSITVSLSSSRMSTGAKDLLRLLSILPDGLSDVELVQSKLSVNDIMTCKATLLATSLAYMDDKRRLKSLVPIREHIQCFYPPSPLLIHPLQKYFHHLLDLYQQYPRTQQGAGRVKHLTLNVRNMGELLLRGLNQDNPNLAETIDCTLSMSVFTRNVDSGYYHRIAMLMDQIEAVLPGNCDEKFRAQLILWKFETRSLCLATNADMLITQAISHFHQFNDPALECEKMAVALKYLHKALDLAKSHGDIREALVLNHLGLIKWSIGDYVAAQKHAQASHRLAELAGDLNHQSLALRTSALCYRRCGNIQSSIFLYQRARKLLELGGVTTGWLSINLSKELAEAHLFRSEYAEARNIYTLLAPDAAEESYDYAWTLLNIAQLDIIIGASKQDVLSNLDKAMALFDAYRYGNYNVMSAKIYCNIELGKLHLREGEILTAKGILQTCFNSTWGDCVQGKISCMESFANIKGWPKSDFHWASGWSIVYLGYAKKLGEKIALHRALQFLGDVFQAEGDSATSTSLFTIALEGFTWMNIHHSRAECMLCLGDLAKGHREVSKAIEHWKTARPLFERSSQAKQVAQIDERLAAITSNMLEEPTDSLMCLGQLNSPIAAVADEIHPGTQAEEREVEGGEGAKDKLVMVYKMVRDTRQHGSRLAGLVSINSHCVCGRAPRSTTVGGLEVEMDADGQHAPACHVSPMSTGERAKGRGQACVFARHLSCTRSQVQVESRVTWQWVVKLFTKQEAAAYDKGMEVGGELYGYQERRAVRVPGIVS
ncbi:hypothetical protein FB451DRAFT_1378267 [Mycena latifolia]|nr:hypothetical protein FB451DRAFT_1378267 [Mycena latifolia]